VSGWGGLGMHALAGPCSISASRLDAKTVTPPLVASPTGSPPRSAPGCLPPPTGVPRPHHIADHRAEEGGGPTLGCRAADARGLPAAPGPCSTARLRVAVPADRSRLTAWRRSATHDLGAPCGRPHGLHQAGGVRGPGHHPWRRGRGPGRCGVTAGSALALLPEPAPRPWWLVALGCLVALLGLTSCWVPRFRRRAVLVPWGILACCLVVLLALHFLPSVARVPDAGPLLGTHWPRLRAHATAGRPRVRHWPSAMRHSCLSFPLGGPPL
jgi:hypothetical protein